MHKNTQLILKFLFFINDYILKSGSSIICYVINIIKLN